MLITLENLWEKDCFAKKIAKVRELVDAMHEKIVPKGVYVIREGIRHPSLHCHYSFFHCRYYWFQQCINLMKCVNCSDHDQPLNINIKNRWAGLPPVCVRGGRVRGDQGWQGLGQVHHHLHHQHYHDHHHHIPNLRTIFMMILQKDSELERLSESWRFSTTASEQQASRSVWWPWSWSR